MGNEWEKLEYIENSKSRIRAFKIRKEWLEKKLHELTTLCDIGAGMIIYEPTQGQSSIWPEQNPGEFRRLIDAYGGDSGVISRRVRPYGLSEFFERKRRKAEKQTKKLRRENSNFDAHSYDHCLNLMGESQLRELGYALWCKAQAVRSRIQFLKTINNANMDSDMISSSHQFFNPDQEIMDYNLIKFDKEIINHVSTTTDHNSDIGHMIGSQSHEYYALPRACMINFSSINNGSGKLGS